MRIWRKSLGLLLLLLVYGTNAWWPFSSNEVEEPKPDLGESTKIDAEEIGSGLLDFNKKRFINIVDFYYNFYF